jgi:hypothetical protein
MDMDYWESEMKIGTKIAWTMFDKNVMTGQIIDNGYGYFMVRRVDGSICTVDQSKVRVATLDDIDASIAFYTTRS